jgi:ubiquinone/menaquinone biosynthesis C-methylase UbiE
LAGAKLIFCALIDIDIAHAIHMSRLRKLFAEGYRGPAMMIIGRMKYHGLSGAAMSRIIRACAEKSDVEIMNMILAAMPRRKVTAADALQDRRAASRAADVKKLIAAAILAPMPRVAAYLDVGAGDGIITDAIAAALDVRAAHAVDVKEWMGHSMAAAPRIRAEWRFTDGKSLPYATASMGLVTMFQTIHHFQFAAAMLDEVARVAAPGCVLVIREHDVRDAFDAALVDLEHMTHSTLSLELAPEEFEAKYFASYRAADALTAEFVARGFVSVMRVAMKNPTRTYDEVFIRGRGA